MGQNINGHNLKKLFRARFSLDWAPGWKADGRLIVYDWWKWWIFWYNMSLISVHVCLYYSKTTKDQYAVFGRPSNLEPPGHNPCSQPAQPLNPTMKSSLIQNNSWQSTLFLNANTIINKYKISLIFVLCRNCRHFRQNVVQWDVFLVKTLHINTAILSVNCKCGTFTVIVNTIILAASFTKWTSCF